MGFVNFTFRKVYLERAIALKSIYHAGGAAY